MGGVLFLFNCRDRWSFYNTVQEHAKCDDLYRHKDCVIVNPVIMWYRRIYIYQDFCSHCGKNYYNKADNSRRNTFKGREKSNHQTCQACNS